MIWEHINIYIRGVKDKDNDDDDDKIPVIEIMICKKNIFDLYILSFLTTFLKKFIHY